MLVLFSYSLATHTELLDKIYKENDTDGKIIKSLISGEKERLEVVRNSASSSLSNLKKEPKKTIFELIKKTKEALSLRKKINENFKSNPRYYSDLRANNRDELYRVSYLKKFLFVNRVISFSEQKNYSGFKGDILFAKDYLKILDKIEKTHFLPTQKVLKNNIITTQKPLKITNTTKLKVAQDDKNNTSISQVVQLQKSQMNTTVYSQNINVESKAKASIGGLSIGTKDTE